MAAYSIKMTVYLWLMYLPLEMNQFNLRLQHLSQCQNDSIQLVAQILTIIMIRINSWLKREATRFESAQEWTLMNQVCWGLPKYCGCNVMPFRGIWFISVLVLSTLPLRQNILTFNPWILGIELKWQFYFTFTKPILYSLGCILPS